MRTTHPDVTPLEQVSLYRGVPRGSLEVVAAHTDVLRLPAGREVARAGRFAGEFLALVEGTVVVSDDEGHDLRAPAGATFGAAELIDDQPHRLTVTTRTDVTFVVITAAAFRASVRDIPQVAHRLRPVA